MKYAIDKKTGILKQIDAITMKYSKQYIRDRYDQYGELPNYMAYLRYGFMVGIIKEPIYTICDVGYGNGAFLKVCNEAKIEMLVGVDISGYKLPDHVIIQSKTIPMNMEYDVVTFFDSLEHFPEIGFVKDLKTKYIMISYPECPFYEDRKGFLKWKHRRPNEHIWHFNQESVEGFFWDCGFKRIAGVNVEDIIRKPENPGEINIMTMIFKKL